MNSIRQLISMSALDCDDPAPGSEVVDESGRTDIWGSGGVHFGLIPADRF